MKIRSAVIIAIFLVVLLLVVTNFSNVPGPFRLPVFVGLAIFTSLIILALGLGEKVSPARQFLAVFGMFVVTAVYLSYLHREVVIASVIITAFVTAVTYIRVAREYSRRRYD